ncbi:MAG: UbiD family decarboxylase, partial [Actinobacteria bacterium]|nr:UbiD family decarboxylase [Actinomycetota bacterium]
VRVKAPVDSNLEITEVLNRLLKNNGPAVIFENVKGYNIPVVANLFGTVKRVAMGLGTDEAGLTEVGEFLGTLDRPEPPDGIIDAIKKIPFYKQMLGLSPKVLKNAPCQEVVLTGEDVDLNKFPVLRCWPDDAGPLITWPLVVTKDPESGIFNVGVYRIQVLSKNTAIMRWLKHRGGAHHQRKWASLGHQSMDAAVAIGNDPAMIISATTPVPEQLDEFLFAGVLRKKSVNVVKCKTVDLQVPATSEIVLEGEVIFNETAVEGPFGDHTGYYNAAEPFNVFKIKCITHRANPLYLTTVTGRPPREDAILALGINKIFIPLLKKSFPEIVDFSLPMEAVSYRIAVVSIKKEYPGHAKRIMMGIWGFLKQFLYVKYIIVVDDDIDVNSWDDVIWALATRVDPARDSTIIEDTPIDYLDFASPKAELGSKMGIDATIKYPPEADREWGKKIEMDSDIVEQVDKRWKEFGLD